MSQPKAPPIDPARIHELLPEFEAKALLEHCVAILAPGQARHNVLEAINCLHSCTRDPDAIKQVDEHLTAVNRRELARSNAPSEPSEPSNS